MFASEIVILLLDTIEVGRKMKEKQKTRLVRDDHRPYSTAQSMPQK